MQIRVKYINVAFAFSVMCHTAFADSESLRQLAKNVGIEPAKLEYVGTECTKDAAKAKAQVRQSPPHEQTYKFEITRLECEIAMLSASVLSSTQGMIETLSYGYEEYDKLLNKYYNLYRAEYKKQNQGKGQDTLLEEQRAWLNLRDSYETYLRQHRAHIYESNGGGTMWSVIANGTKLTFLKKRVEELFLQYKTAKNGEAIEFYSIFGNISDDNK